MNDPVQVYKDAYYLAIEQGKSQEEAHKLGHIACEQAVASRLKDPQKHKHGVHLN